MDLSLCMAAGLITVDPLAASATSVFVLTITSLKAALFQNSNQQTVQAMVVGGIVGPMTLTLTGTLSTLLNLINYQVQHWGCIYNHVGDIYLSVFFGHSSFL